MKLRDYQIEDVQKLKQFNAIGCFNEQRTGKTPIALALLKEKNCTRNLIICPGSAVFQWQDEYDTWLNQPCIILLDNKKKDFILNNLWTHGLVISYDMFKTTHHHVGISDYIKKHPPDAIILDEAHKIKNTRTAAARAVFQVTAPVRIALTGTPSPNKPEEIFSILHWLYPEKFKSYWKFIDEYFNKVVKQNAQGRHYVEITGFRFSKDKELQKFLDKYTTQRKRKEVMQWLPEKDYQRVRLPCTSEQIKYLNELHNYYETEHVVVQGILDRLMRYRQICLHPALLNLKGESPKLNWLKTYLTDNPNRPTIIFSKFTSFLKLLNKELPEKKGLIIGETSIKTRNQLKLDFQNGIIDLLLINIDVGKEALTLDRAEVAIFTDKYPPAGDIVQAEDRFVSTTESKADKPHLIIELMMKNTYDEQLYKLVVKRKEISDIINDYKKYLKGVHTHD